MLLLLLLLAFVAAAIRLDYEGNARNTELRSPQDVFCPSDTYVTGFKLRSTVLEGTYREWKFGGITGLILLCRGSVEESEEIEVTTAGNHGNYSVARECPCNSVVMSAKIQTVKQSNDTIINNINMYCKGTVNTLVGSGQHKGRWSDKFTCPKNASMCGISVVFLDRRIDGINLKCCSQPQIQSQSQCNTTVSRPDPLQWAPTYHFDPGHQCWPDPEEAAYNGSCRKEFSDDVPVYAFGLQCGRNAYKIDYLLYYGFQKPCFLIFGSHAEDWEHIRLNFVLCGAKYCIDSVTYRQHSGRYTVPYVESGDRSVHAYIGRMSHGSYHTGCTIHGDRSKDQRCIGGCGYFEDFRRPGGVVWTPHNVTELQKRGKSWEKEPPSCGSQGCHRNQWIFC